MKLKISLKRTILIGIPHRKMFNQSIEKVQLKNKKMYLLKFGQKETF